MPQLVNNPRNLGKDQPTKPIQIDRTPFEDEQERIYWVAIGTAQLASLHQANELPVNGLMLEESEKRQLDGPGRDAA